MTHRNLIGIDIGGTKCAVSYGQQQAGTLTVADKIHFATTSVDTTLTHLKEAVHEIMQRHGLDRHNTAAIGISCGGPLDSRTGRILSPPNLPGWDNIPIVEIFHSEFGLPVAVHNDANACALAEWQFGAGQGSRNMVFLTFGTGLGAGLILDGQLYTGTNDNAGEVGHIRLNDFGPVGYGKAGSFEGFCSGGGIRQLAQSAVKEQLQMGQHVAWCPEGNLDQIDARTVAEAALGGDPLAREIYTTSAHYLGIGLSMIIDLINPELIVIGSIYARNEQLFKSTTEAILAREALSHAHRVCRIEKAALGEAIGDYAALSVAANIHETTLNDKK